MKKTLLFAFALTVSAFFAACSSDDLDTNVVNVMPPAVSSEANQSLFPEEGKAKMVSKNGAEALFALLKSPKFNMEAATKLHNATITDSQWNAIKEYVDKNLKGATETETYKRIFKWCHDSLTYTHDGPSLEPYDVFTNRRCICQGYANLCKTMLLTQGIPAFGVNGSLGTLGAHAWLYAYDGKNWHVSDPTNNMEFLMKDVSKYKNKLMVERTEIELFEDENFGYNYNESRLNVCRVKQCEKEALTVPFAVAGYKIGSFLLEDPLPANIRQIYFGTNIQSLGTQGYPLFGRANSVEEAFVAPGNRLISSQDGVIYHGTGTNVYYIPTAIHRLVLKPMKVIGKNTVYDKPNLEEIVISEGTTTVEDYAFESCPSLKRVYVPQSVTNFSKDALYRCPDDVEILRVSTGIHHVTM